MRRRLNPWKEGLDNLSNEASLGEAIALLAGPALTPMVLLFIIEIFKTHP